MTLLTTRLGQWVVGMAFLIAILGALTAAGAAAPMEDAASAVFSPVQRAVRQAAEPIANLVTNIDDFDAVDDENRALRNRVEQLESEIARLREDQIQVRGRESLRAVQEARADAIFVTADIVTRDLTGLRDIIAIDRGTNDGVQDGQPVLAAGGALVGVVTDARANRAFVRLVTDPDSSIRVLHQLSRTEGILEGDTDGNLRVRFVPQATDVQPGHSFVTSGLGGLFPQGIPVGSVSAAEGTAQEVFKRIRLRPLAPLEQLESVLVEVSFIPTPVSIDQLQRENADDDAAADDATSPDETESTP